MNGEIKLILKLLGLTILFYIVSNVFGLLPVLADYFFYESKYFELARCVFVLIGNIFFLVLIYYWGRTNKFNNDKIPRVDIKLLSFIIGIIYASCVLIFKNAIFNKIPNKIDPLQICIIPIFLSSIIVIPILEEIFFRKYLISTLKTKFQFEISIMFSSILFSLVHLPYLSSSLFAFFGGCIAGFIFYRTNKLVNSIFFHVGWNLTIFIFQKIIPI